MIIGCDLLLLHQSQLNQTSYNVGSYKAHQEPVEEGEEEGC